METETKKGCGCGGNASPRQPIIPTVTVKPWSSEQKDLVDIIRAVQERKSKTYKTRLRSPL
jgi:hypothetical protein